MSLRNRVTVKEKVVYCIYHTDETTAAYRYLFGENFDKIDILPRLKCVGFLGANVVA